MRIYPLRYKKLLKILSKYNIYEDRPKFGKGSHRILRSKITNRFYTIPLHSRNAEIGKEYIKAVRKVFNLTPDDGISDKEFYGHK